MTARKLKKVAGYALAIAVISAGIYFYAAGGSFLKERQDISFGVTFSTVMARQLGLDWRQTLDAIVRDLAVKTLRVPVYWSDIEPKRGEFDFSDYDYIVKSSEQSGVKLILVIGRKLPRWPECHVPEWSRGLGEEEHEYVIDRQIKAVVERYRASPAVSVWQVENEPFHVFGAECAEKKIKAVFVDREIDLVRSLDSRPIMLTDAGKAGTWFTSLRRVEVLGVTMYYQVWNPWRGRVWSTFGPGLYIVKRKILALFFPGKRFFVAELQAEPYGPNLLPDYDLALQKELMNVARFQETIRRARKAGFEENYLWGAEWWYWLKEKQNDPSIWEEAKSLFKNVGK